MSEFRPDPGRAASFGKGGGGGGSRMNSWPVFFFPWMTREREGERGRGREEERES